MIMHFIETELHRQHDNADMAEDDRIKDFTEINTLFRGLIING